MLEKLTDRIYYMPNDHSTDRPLLGLVCGDRASLVVDAGNSPAHARVFLEEALKVATSPIRYLALTHWHWDHIFGIGTMSLTSLCSEKTKAVLDRMNTYSWEDESLEERVKSGEEIAFCRDNIRLEMPDREGFRTQRADISFSDRLEVDLGGIHCVLVHVGGGHSEDSVLVHVPEEEVLFTGDALYEDYYSGALSYDMEQLVPLVNRVRKFPSRFYLGSHENPQTHEEFWTIIDNLVRIGEAVGFEIDKDRVDEKFISTFGKEPDEEETFFIQSFLEGNLKVRSQEENTSRLGEESKEEDDVQS